jgi:hypothetical protein
MPGQAPQPKVPASLDPLARDILERLKGRPEARAVVLGGGVALQHYLEYRRTVDLDAWWEKDVRPEAETVIQAASRSRLATSSSIRRFPAPGAPFRSRAFVTTLAPR